MSVHVCNGWILQCAAWWSIIDSTKFMKGMDSNCQIREICTSAYTLSTSIQPFVHHPANDFQTCKPNRTMTSERTVSFMRTVAWHVNIVIEGISEKQPFRSQRATGCKAHRSTSHSLCRLALLGKPEHTHTTMWRLRWPSWILQWNTGSHQPNSEESVPFTCSWRSTPGWHLCAVGTLGRSLYFHLFPSISCQLFGIIQPATATCPSRTG